MQDFTFYNPTKIIFGKDSLASLKQQLSNYGENVMIAYGKSSIKKIGLYDKIVAILHSAHKHIFECEGIMPNPTYEKVLEGTKIVRENKVDLILAVGGGSVIDCAKAISVAAYEKEDAWKKYWIDFKKVDHKVVPIGAILTMTGTASECDGGSVITNEKEHLKVGRVFDYDLYPRFALLDPSLTFTLPHYQMVSGISDIFSHLMEQYFSNFDENVTDYLIEGIMKCLISSTYKALKNPMDYEARSNIMWCSSLALQGVAGLGKEQDWEVHAIEHQLSAYTDCAHGMGLAAIGLPYYRYIYKDGIDKFVRFAINVWDVKSQNKQKDEIALEGISKLESFFHDCGIVTSLKELGASEEMLPLIANSCSLGGGYKKLNHQEILSILKKCY